MEVYLQLFIPYLPEPDQRYPYIVKFFEKNTNCEITYRSNNSYIDVHINGDITKQVLFEKLHVLLKSAGWSTNMFWNKYKVLCVRPIESIFIKIDGEICSDYDHILGIEVVSHNVNIPLTWDQRHNIIVDQVKKYNIDNKEQEDFLNINTTIYNDPIITEVPIVELGLPQEIVIFLLKKHFFALYYQGKALCVTNKHDNAHIEKMSNSINARIKDYRLLMDIDLQTPIGELLLRNSNKIINNHIGSVEDEKTGVKNLFHLFYNKRINKNLEDYFKFYRISLCTNLIQEDHELEDIFSHIILEHNHITYEITNYEQQLIKMCKNLFTLNKLVEYNKTYTSKKDPFAMKRKIKQIIEIIEQNNIIVPDQYFGKSRDLIGAKINNNPLFNQSSLTKKIFLNRKQSQTQSTLKRLKNLYGKINNVSLNEQIDINVHNYDSFLDEINHFIDNNMIIGNNENCAKIVNYYRNLLHFIES